MNNTTGATGKNPLTGWKDTQIWELGPALGPEPNWILPFAVDTASDNPLPGGPAASIQYGIFRATFFQSEPPPVISATNPQYPSLHAPTFTPAAGSYERWYVANIGNMQPVMPTDAATGTVPDMHPFHMHLVNFVVVRRWILDVTGQFVPKPARLLDFDGISRHDTVRVEANELVELLVHFPVGYKGKYVYHCHLVEHEDMGMMLHFETV